MIDEQIDRGRVRKLAAYYSGGDPRMPSGLTWAEVLDLLDAIEQAETERDACRAKMDELDRAYLSEHEQRKRAEARIKAVEDVLDKHETIFGANTLVPADRICRALDGDA